MKSICETPWRILFREPSILNDDIQTNTTDHIQTHNWPYSDTQLTTFRHTFRHTTGLIQTHNWPYSDTQLAIFRHTTDHIQRHNWPHSDTTDHIHTTDHIQTIFMHKIPHSDTQPTTSYKGSFLSTTPTWRTRTPRSLDWWSSSTFTIVPLY